MTTSYGKAFLTVNGKEERMVEGTAYEINKRSLFRVVNKTKNKPLCITVNVNKR